MTITPTPVRSGNDLVHVGLAGYRLEPRVARKRDIVLAHDVAVLQTVDAPVDASGAWNARLDALGGRRGTWDELRALLPT